MKVTSTSKIHDILKIITDQTFNIEIIDNSYYFKGNMNILFGNKNFNIEDIFEIENINTRLMKLERITSYNNYYGLILIENSINPKINIKNLPKVYLKYDHWFNVINDIIYEKLGFRFKPLLYVARFKNIERIKKEINELEVDFMLNCE